MKTISHIVIFLFISTTVLAQSYDNLWKQYRQYADKDLPKSALTVLEKIKAKAEKENSYGNLLAVLLREVNHQEEISTDSGKVFRERLDQRIAASNDGVIKTLYRVAKGERIDIDSLLSSADSAIYRQKDASLQWLPFFEKGKDSKIFNNDLLHVILLQSLLILSWKNMRLLQSLKTFFNDNLNANLSPLLSLFFGVQRCGGW